MQKKDSLAVKHAWNAGESTVARAAGSINPHSSLLCGEVGRWGPLGRNNRRQRERTRYIIDIII